MNEYVTLELQDDAEWVLGFATAVNGRFLLSTEAHKEFARTELKKARRLLYGADDSIGEVIGHIDAASRRGISLGLAADYADTLRELFSAMVSIVRLPVRQYHNDEYLYHRHEAIRALAPLALQNAEVIHSQIMSAIEADSSQESE